MADLAKSFVDLQAEIKSSTNKRNAEMDPKDDGSRKKGRLTLVAETTEFLKSLAVQGIQEIQQMKAVDEGHHRAIVNLVNVAGSAYDERQDLLANDNFLLNATKAEISALQIRTAAIEKSLEEIKLNLGL